MRFSVLANCLAILLMWNAAAHAQSPPNVVFIMADDFGYADLGSYGQKEIKTPHLDKLATEGLRFTNYYAGSTVCAPSRCVLMTGLHTGHAEIRGNTKVNLPDASLTLAEVFKQAGYQTGAFGKWGLGSEDGAGRPLSQGFDQFTGYIDQTHAHNYFPTYLIRGNDRITLPNVVPNLGRYGQGVASERKEYSHDVIMRDALSFLERAGDKPFFLYLPITLPHANNEGREAGMEIPSYGEYADRDWTIAEKGFAAMIRRLDNDVADVMAILKRKGLENNTLVIFTSDNGPHREGGHDPDFFNSNGELRGYKRDMYEGGIRVPLIVRWPGHVQQGKVSAHIAYHGDWLATFSDLLKQNKPTGLDSTSLLPTLLDQPGQQSPEFLYWEFLERGFDQAVRSGDWKYIRSSRGEELYNLATDLSEQKNVAAEQPEQVARLRGFAEKSHVDHPSWPIRNRPENASRAQE